MAEFCVAFPLVLLFFAGMVQLGWLFLAQNLLNTTTQHVSLYMSANPEGNTEFVTIFFDRMKPLPNGGSAIPNFNLRVDEDLEDSDLWENTEQGSKIIKTNFVIARLAEMNEQKREHWLRAKTPTLQVTWCFPLRVPVVNQLFEKALKKSNECMVYGVAGTPYVRLESQTRFTMKSDFQMPNGA